MGDTKTKEAKAGQFCPVMPSGVWSIHDRVSVGNAQSRLRIDTNLSAVDVLDGLLAEEEVDVLFVRESAHKIRRCRECKGKRE